MQRRSSIFGGFVRNAVKNGPATEMEIAEDLDLRLCNCCECKKPLVAVGDWPRLLKACLETFGRKPEELFATAARIKDRPYCRDCLNSR